MVLRPEAEAYLQEGQPWVVVILLGEALVELQEEPLVLRIRPVRESGVAAFALGLCFVVAGQRFDVVRNRGLLAGPGLIEAQYGLVLAACDRIELALDGGPVVLAFGSHYVVVAHVRVLECDRVRVAILGVLPHDDAGHRLDIGDVALEGARRNGPPGWLSVAARLHRHPATTNKTVRMRASDRTMASGPGFRYAQPRPAGTGLPPARSMARTVVFSTVTGAPAAGVFRNPQDAPIL